VLPWQHQTRIVSFKPNTQVKECGQKPVTHSWNSLLPSTLALQKRDCQYWPHVYPAAESTSYASDWLWA